MWCRLTYGRRSRETRSKSCVLSIKTTKHHPAHRCCSWVHQRGTKHTTKPTAPPVTWSNINIDSDTHERFGSLLQMTLLLKITQTARNGRGECVRLKNFVVNAHVAGNTIQHCGLYDYEFGDGKNGEGIYIGTSTNQVWRDESWGRGSFVVL